MMWATILALVLGLAGCDRDRYWRLEGPVTIIFRNGQTTTCQELRKWFGEHWFYDCVQPDGILRIERRDVGSIKAPRTEWSESSVTWRR